MKDMRQYLEDKLVEAEEIYRDALEKMDRDCKRSRHAMERPDEWFPNGSWKKADKQTGYVDSFRLNVSQYASQVVFAAARVEAAVEALQRLDFTEQMERHQASKS